MKKTAAFVAAGIGAGLILAYSILFIQTNFFRSKNAIIAPVPLIQSRNVIGFLPYWLIPKASSDYSKYITTLTYFGLTLDTDGHIAQLTNPQEEEPGWLALKSGKINPFLTQAKKNGVNTSLLVFAADNDNIAQLMSDPIVHADKLMDDVIPIMKQYGFADLNIDIEATGRASDSARIQFTSFIKRVKQRMAKEHVGTLTLDVSPTDLIKKDLINVQDVAGLADWIVLMTYDYHYLGSQVTGPISPLGGAGIESEFDTEAAVAKALEIMPGQEILLGAPLYGYEWETMGSVPRSAVIPQTGITDSSRSVLDFLSECATCSAQFDTTAQESYVIYHDDATGTNHQMFYPDARSTQSKIRLAQDMQLGGIAIWALGYEGKNILDPLQSYK